MIVLRTACLAALVVLLAATPAHAAERPLKGPEIDTLLKGNTVVGQSDGGAWKQFFDANGETTYAGGSRPPSMGTWNVQGDKFCSQWPPNDHWVCYDVTGDLDAKPRTITWIAGGSGTKYPGTVQAGKGL